MKLWNIHIRRQFIFQKPYWWKQHRWTQKHWAKPKKTDKRSNILWKCVPVQSTWPTKPAALPCDGDGGEPRIGSNSGKLSRVTQVLDFDVCLSHWLGSVGKKIAKNVQRTKIAPGWWNTVLGGKKKSLDNQNQNASSSQGSCSKGIEM